MILTNSLNAAERRVVDDRLEEIRRAPTAQLRSITKEVDRLLVLAVERFGVKANLNDLERLITFDVPDETMRHTYNYIAKAVLASAFDRYDSAYRFFDKLPPHSRIAVDVFGVRPDGAGVEIVILEAVLHEDMATLWNAALDALAGLGDTRPARVVKHAEALSRAVAKAAFNLLEGYLNGLALDVILLGKPVTLEQRELLTEFDTKRERPKMVGLRDKLLQYPKIAAGALHPPIQESSHAVMARILMFEKRIRHALVHPNPLVDMARQTESRELVFFMLDLNEVGAICDDVIALIAGIADAVGPEYGEVRAWLHQRQGNGRFSEEIFE